MSDDTYADFEKEYLTFEQLVERINQYSKRIKYLVENPPAPGFWHWQHFGSHSEWVQQLSEIPSELVDHNLKELAVGDRDGE
jgi:hypothetical protein